MSQLPESLGVPRDWPNYAQDFPILTQAMCRGCFQTRGDCQEHQGVMVCKRCWPRRATIALKAKVE